MRSYVKSRFSSWKSPKITQNTNGCPLPSLFVLSTFVPNSVHSWWLCVCYSLILFQCHRLIGRPPSSSPVPHGKVCRHILIWLGLTNQTVLCCIPAPANRWCEEKWAGWRVWFQLPSLLMQIFLRELNLPCFRLVQVVFRQTPSTGSHTSNALQLCRQNYNSWCWFYLQDRCSQQLKPHCSSEDRQWAAGPC